ncbi:unnamed protein product [Sphagnum compactum]
MCILCVASRWSRRIVTMLPWLIIPLIILWALSQLLPPNFRFEVTSPRLACVGVMLVSLGWYELAMPRLSQWRARRSAFLRERRRIEAQEAAKWRKEATRRCRNCWSAYRDQTPVGGKFMCTYCGHVSRRPVLDVPSSNSTHVAGIPGGGPYGSWSPYWGDGGGGGGYGSYGGGGGFFGGGDKCRGDSAMFSLFRVFSLLFVSLRWLCQKAWRDERVTEDPLSGGSRGSQHSRGGGGGEDGSTKEGSRGEKARRKAEEKRQARMEREQLEAEERRQREEVARLVEERRRLRDEKMEAKRESEREAAAERERELRREREAERRRQEKLKERERSSSGDLSKERTSSQNVAEDSEESKKDSKKMARDIKSKDSDKKAVEGEKKTDGSKVAVLGQANSGDPVKKVNKAARAADLSGKAGEVKIAGGALKPRIGGIKGSVAANSKTHITNSTSFWGKGTQNSGPKTTKDTTTYSAWNRMPWTKVWGKGFSAPAAEKSMDPSELLPNSIVSELNSSNDAAVERGSWNGRNHCIDGINDSELLPNSERERDPIKQVVDGPFEALFGQGLSGSTYVAPIGPQPPIHAPAAGLSWDGMVPIEQPPQILEPWAADESNLGPRRQAFRAVNELLGEEAASGEGKWRMWEAPQLDQIQLPSVFVNQSPSPWMLPLGSRVSERAAPPSPSCVGVSGDLETQFPASLFSPQPTQNMTSVGSDPLNGILPAQLNSRSLWSDQSAFESAMRIWDDGDLVHQPHLPAEFIDCITQEVMQDPVITADGHSYERSAILRWLQTHDTSPITGEVLPPLPGVNGTVVDKTLRPNHILRGQIIEYRENLARLARGMGMHAEKSGKQESTSSRPTGVVVGSAPWSTPSIPSTERANNIGGFYTTPTNSQSLWSYNIS